MQRQVAQAWEAQELRPEEGRHWSYGGKHVVLGRERTRSTNQVGLAVSGTQQEGKEKHDGAAAGVVMKEKMSGSGRRTS
jgi:hypothetical protein